MLIVSSLAMALMLALAGIAGAASPGEPLPAGAVEVEVWYLPWDFTWSKDFTGWSTDPADWTMSSIGDLSAPGRSWNSQGANSGGLQNKENYNFTFTNHASVAQWVDWSISGTRKDWRVLRPGIYAADSITFSLLSNNDVEVTFSGFGDLQYEEPDVPEGTQDTIETWYGYGGGTLESVINWVRASELNGTLLIANTNDLHYGQTIKLWSRIQVEPSNNSSDYENRGLITLSLTNMKHWVDPVTGQFAQ